MGIVAAAWLVAGVAAASPEPTLQQRFEAASAALEAGDDRTALAGFDEVGRLAKAPRTRAVADLRAGVALHNLRRNAEAAPRLRQALAALSPGEAALREDRFNALIALGAIEEARLDYAPARLDDAAALALAGDPADGITARLALARTTLFADPDRAYALAGEALALMPKVPGLSAKQRGQVRTLRGRALLNAGRPREALAELRRAVDQLGGLTERVDMADIDARSDLAIAALRAGDDAAAKQYLAFSGAGTLPETLPRGIDMDPPACGDGGLQPEDAAVVEFGIVEDGHVGFARPIYSSARGDRALVFAQAVNGWTWAPEAVAKVPALFRATMRVELRCTTAEPRPGVQDYVRRKAAAWADEHAEPVAAAAGNEGPAATLAAWRAELARRQAAGTPAAPLPVLMALMADPAAPVEARAGWAADGLATAQRAGAPPMVRLLFQLTAIGAGWGARTMSPAARMAELRRLLDDRALADDPETGAAIRLLIAERTPGRQRAADVPALQQVADDARLPPDSALRQAALVRLAGAQLAAGKPDLARAAYARSGLSGEQCSLVDVEPARVRGGISSDDFPKEALRWNMGGWAITEYDVRADGTPDHVRTLVAFPPFVFGPVTDAFINRSRFTQSFRPNGGLGCGGNRQAVNFQPYKG